MKKNKKNAFTLVELLAVIVILAIILVIAVPKVMSVIEDAKKATLESTAKMIAGSAEKVKVQNTVLGKDEEITCDSVAKINKLDYETCEVVFEDNTAKVSIKGSGKFEGLWVCNGDKTNVTAQNEACDDVNNGQHGIYYGQPYNSEYDGNLVTIIFSEFEQDGVKTITAYVNGTFDENISYKINDNVLTTGVGTDAETEFGVLSSDGTEITTADKWVFSINTNYHDLYYGKYYSIEQDGVILSFIFNENGAVDYYQNYALVESVPENTVSYSENSIDMSLINMGVGTFSIDGTQIIIQGEDGLVLTLDNGPAVHFGEAYTHTGTDENGENYTLTILFHENGTYNYYVDGHFNATNNVTYTKDAITVTDGVLSFEVLDDGTQLLAVDSSGIFDGMVFKLDLAFEPLD